MFKFVCILFLTIHSIYSSVRIIDDCQLLIIGGSTSALGAAISASKILKTSKVGNKSLRDNPQIGLVVN
jgi:hypothetical protein